MIKATKLTVTINGKKIFHNLNFEIMQGDFIFLAGLNGSGKSTLIKTLCGLIQYEGSITIDNQEIKTLNKDEITSKVAVLFQSVEDYFFNSTIIDEILFSQKKYNNVSAKQLLKKYLIKNDEMANPQELSGGEKEKLALATMEAADTFYLFLDEALAMLDQEAKKHILLKLQELHQEGKTIILTSHNLDEAIYANRIFILENKIIEINQKNKKLLNKYF